MENYLKELENVLRILERKEELKIEKSIRRLCYNDGNTRPRKRRKIC